MENCGEFLEEKRQLRREVEALEAAKGQLCRQLKELQSYQLDSMNNRLTVPIHSSAEVPMWKERTRDLELLAVGKELATSKVKIERLERALENSDRKIAELESELCLASPFTAFEVKPMFCPKPSKAHGMRSPAPRLKRLPEAMGSSPSSSPFPLHDKTEPKPLQLASHNDNRVGYFNVTFTENGSTPGVRTRIRTSRT